MADREDSERLRSDSRSDFVTVSRTPECLLKVHSPKTVQSLQGTFTTYCISFQTNSPAFQLRKSRVRRRFSEFVWLRKKLTKMNNWGTPPPLPAKRFWNVLDPDLIQSRQEQLEKWIYTVLSEEEYLSYSALHLFLQTELSTAEIQDYLDGVLPEDTIRDLWNNHGRRYNYQPHNPLHNFVDQDPVEILFTADDITTPGEANPTSAIATPQPPSPEDPATTTTATTTTTVTTTTVKTTAIITATPTPHPEADNSMGSPPKTGGKFQEHSFEGSHDHLQDALARQNSGSDVEEAQRSSTDWGHLRPGQGANAPQLKQEQQKEAQQKQTQQKQEQAQQKQEQAQRKQEHQEQTQQKQEQAQQKQAQQKQAQQKQTQQKQEQAQQKQEQAQLKQEQEQAQQKQEQAQQKQEHQEQEQHEKTQQQIFPTQPGSKIAGSQEDSQAATTRAGLLTAGTAAAAERKVGKKTGVDLPDLQSSSPAVGLVLSINSD